MQLNVDNIFMFVSAYDDGAADLRYMLDILTRPAAGVTVGEVRQAAVDALKSCDVVGSDSSSDDDDDNVNGAAVVGRRRGHARAEVDKKRRSKRLAGMLATVLSLLQHARPRVDDVATLESAIASDLKARGSIGDGAARGGADNSSSGSSGGNEHQTLQAVLAVLVRALKSDARIVSRSSAEFKVAVSASPPRSKPRSGVRSVQQQQQQQQQPSVGARDAVVVRSAGDSDDNGSGSRRSDGGGAVLTIYQRLDACMSSPSTSFVAATLRTAIDEHRLPYDALMSAVQQRLAVMMAGEHALASSNGRRDRELRWQRRCGVRDSDDDAHSVPPRLLDLPAECLLRVFTFLPAVDVLELSVCCRFAYELSCSDSVWRYKARRHYGVPPNERVPARCWKAFFLHLAAQRVFAFGCAAYGALGTNRGTDALDSVGEVAYDGTVKSLQCNAHSSTILSFDGDVVGWGRLNRDNFLGVPTAVQGEEADRREAAAGGSGGRPRRGGLVYTSRGYRNELGYGVGFCRPILIRSLYSRGGEFVRKRRYAADAALDYDRGVSAGQLHDMFSLDGADDGSVAGDDNGDVDWNEDDVRGSGDGDAATSDDEADGEVMADSSNSSVSDGVAGDELDALLVARDADGPSTTVATTTTAVQPVVATATPPSLLPSASLLRLLPAPAPVAVAAPPTTPARDPLDNSLEISVVQSIVTDSEGNLLSATTGGNDDVEEEHVLNAEARDRAVRRGELSVSQAQRQRTADDGKRLPYPLTQADTAQIASGPFLNIALTRHGEVYTWSVFAMGVPLGRRGDTSQPMLVEKLIGRVVVSVACGVKHFAALTSDGEVYVWGAGVLGVDGAGAAHGAASASSSSPSPSLSKLLTAPTLLAGIRHMRATKVVCGDFFVCVLTESGRAMFAGRIVNPLNTKQTLFLASQLQPLRVANVAHRFIVDVVAGRQHVVLVAGRRAESRDMTLERLLLEDGSGGGGALIRRQKVLRWKR